MGGVEKKRLRTTALKVPKGAGLEHGQYFLADASHEQGVRPSYKDDFNINLNGQTSPAIESGVGGTCGQREHNMARIRVIEYDIASKQSSMMSRYLDSQSREVTLPHS